MKRDDDFDSSFFFIFFYNSSITKHLNYKRIVKKIDLMKDNFKKNLINSQNVTEF